MRKTIVAALAAFSLVAGAGAAVAEKPENPGEKGHCTAFFNGQKKGHEKQDEYPGPFQDLVDRQDDGDDSTGDIAELWDYCEATYGEIGGNPAHGRFATCLTDDDADPDTHNCDD